MRKYRLVAKKGEGTFSEVLKAQNVKDGRYHAIKCMKNRFESIDQVNNLREIQALRRLSPHDHVITLEEVLYDQPTGRLALVFELMDANLYEIIKGRRHYLNPQLIKSYIWQLMKSLDHMHKKGIFHRDIKPENILIESGTELGKGLKLADFGSCRGIYSKQPYTEYISTRWYRAPECLLTDGYYGPEMDLWGAGCVMFEITSLFPLFPGSNEADQISRIHKILGTPSHDIMSKLKSKGASHISFDFPEQQGTGIAPLVQNASPDGLDLIIKLLKYDGSERISAREAMRHPYLKEMKELDMKRNESLASNNGANVAPTAAVAGTSSLQSSPVHNTNPSNNANATYNGNGNSNNAIVGNVISSQKVVLSNNKQNGQQYYSDNNSVLSQVTSSSKPSVNQYQQQSQHNQQIPKPQAGKPLPTILASLDNNNYKQGNNASNMMIGGNKPLNSINAMNPNLFNPNSANSSLPPIQGLSNNISSVNGAAAGGSVFTQKTATSRLIQPINGSISPIAANTASSIGLGSSTNSTNGSNNSNSNHMSSNNSVNANSTRKKKKNRNTGANSYLQNSSSESAMKAYSSNPRNSNAQSSISTNNSNAGSSSYQQSMNRYMMPSTKKG